MVSMITAVIFDMDGVLVDSSIYWKEFESVFNRSLIPGWNGNESKNLVGMNIVHMYDVLKSKFDIPIKKIDFLKAYNEKAKSIYSEKSSLMPNCLEFIKQLKESGFKLSVASSSPLDWIKIAVNRFDLGGYFDAVVSAEDVNFISKPLPDIYLFAAKRLHKKPEECLAIEDAENGVLSAKRAGMKCVGLRNSVNDEQNLSKADLIINNYNELTTNVIRKL